MTRPSDSARIFLSTPTKDRKVYDVWMIGFAQANIRWQGRLLFVVMPELGIQLSRDRLAGQFMETDCTHWLSVDSDIIWTADDAEKLIDLDVDVATGIYAMKDGTNCPVLNPVPDKKPDAPWKIEKAGAGFQLIKRAAVQKLFDAYAPTLGYAFPGTSSSTVAIHQPMIWKGEQQHEDYSLYCRCAEQGIEAWAHPDVIVGHFDGYRQHWPKFGNRIVEKPVPEEVMIFSAPNGAFIVHDQARNITTCATVVEAQTLLSSPRELAVTRWRAEREKLEGAQ